MVDFRPSAVDLMLEWLYEVRGKVLTHEYLVLLATVSFPPYLLSFLPCSLLARRHCMMTMWWVLPRAVSSSGL